MALRLFTPGHGAFMDSLIMYAISSALNKEDVSYAARGMTNYYIIEAEATPQALANSLVSELQIYREEIENFFTSSTRLFQSSQMRKLDKIFKEGFKDTVAYLNELKEPGHTIRANEGRGGKGYTTWLPLNPTLGKYLRTPFKFQPEPYNACPSCISLAILGFRKAIVPLRMRTMKGGRRVNITNSILISFNGEVDGLLLRRLEESIGPIIDELKGRIYGEISLLSSLMTVIGMMKGTLIEDVAHAEASWRALAVTFEVARVAQIRGYSEIIIDSLFDALAKLSSAGRLNQLSWIIEKCVRSGDEAPIDALWRFVISRGPHDLYDFIRLASRLEINIGASLCKELAKLIAD